MDLTNIQSILDTAGEGIGVTDTAVGLFKKVMDAIKGTDGASAETRALVNELWTQVIAAKEKQMATLHAIETLKRELEAIDRFEQKFARYALATTAGQARVYVLKPEHHATEPEHEICPNCVEDRKTSILQPDGRLLICPACKAEYANAPKPTLGVAYGRSDRGIF